MGLMLFIEDVYLCMVVSVGCEGWVYFGYVVMCDYCWGIFLVECDLECVIGFGEYKGELVW